MEKLRFNTLLFSGICVFPALVFSQAKPNFVFIIADDVSWDDIGCYGNDVVKTPNIDRLAREGVRFNNAFLTASSCSPSRCSIISGKYPHSNGAAELHTPLSEKEVPYPLLLKENNYYTAQAGKWHFGTSTHRAFDRYSDNNGYDDGDGGEKNWRFDYYIGKVREELEKQGVLENTVIIVMADNGRPFPRCKTRVYDSGMKTPLVVFWPKGIRSKGAQTESLVSAIDIAPTILELAGINPPDEYQGVSFVPILDNLSAEIRTAIFSEHNWHDFEAHERMIRTNDYLYVLNARPNLTNGGPADSKSSPTQHALNLVRDEGKLTPAQTDIFITPRPAEELFD